MRLGFGMIDIIILTKTKIIDSCVMIILSLLGKIPGGVGYALKTFLHAEVVSGIDYILDLIKYDEIYTNYDLIITGEGKIDSQSLQGKVISSIISKTKERNLIFVCAINELNDNQYNVLSIVGDEVTKEMSMADSEHYYKELLKKNFK